MLDENLPAFFLKPSTSGIKHHREFFLTHHGSEPAPAYHLQYADPASPSPQHKNCYAAALFDAYNPDVLFGEVLARPEWTRPSQSDSQGGVPPPPQPNLPNDFTIQLYNPDQQVKVEVKSSFIGSDTYEFSMPQDVFRAPSASTLDKGQSDPASLETTPRITFVWRKEGRLNKDLTCFMTGKSTDKKKKSSKKDPDIAIGLWRQMRELTIYEPNLGRIDMEDPKGLECVLLLSAVVIKDLYFSDKSSLHDLFNVSDATTSPHKLSTGARKTSNPKQATAAVVPPPQQQYLQATPNAQKRSSLPRLQTTPPGAAAKPPPFPDARAQWELEAETARLKAQTAAEQAEAQRKRREKDKQDEIETKRLQKMVDEEQKAARKRQADIDKETERLRKLYGVTPIPPQQPQRPGPSNGHGYTARQVHSRPYLQPQQAPPRPSSTGPSVVMSGGNGPGVSVGSNGLPKQAKKKKSSFFWA